MTAVLTRQGHLSVSCLTSFRAQLEMTHWVSRGRCRLPSGAASSGPLQTLRCFQRGRALSMCQAHQFELNMCHPSMTHSAKNAEVVPPTSLQPSSIPPGLCFPGEESPPSLGSCKKPRPYSAAAYMVLPLATRRGAHQICPSGLCVV